MEPWNAPWQYPRQNLGVTNLSEFVSDEARRKGKQTAGGVDDKDVGFGVVIVLAIEE